MGRSCDARADLGVPNGRLGPVAVDSPYTPGTAPRSVQALAPRPVGEILSHAAGRYEIDKVTVVQHLSVLCRAGEIHEGRREVATPVWAAGVASGGRWSPFLGPSTQYSERPVLKCPTGDLTHNLLALPKFSSIVYISVPDVHDLGKESDDVSRFVGIRSGEVGSPAGLGADEHQLRELGRRRGAVFAPQLRAPPRQSHPERGHGMQ